jgi:nucleotide-binding universal stress UspA family protein
MMPGRILLPVDVAQYPLEAFSFVNKFAGDHRVTLILLHVINLNAMVPENRVIENLTCLAEQQLERLSEMFLVPGLSVRLRVRVGKPAQEILAEARDSNVDLIILTSYGGSSFWKRPFQRRIVEKVLRATPCNATLLRVRTRSNCEEDRGFLLARAGDNMLATVDPTLSTTTQNRFHHESL